MFDEVSTGATDDRNKVTDIARNMVIRIGMDETLGQVTYETPRQTFPAESAFAHYAEREFSEATAREIDCAVRALVSAAFTASLEILRTHRQQLDEGAKLLLQKAMLVQEDLLRLLDLRPAAVGQ